MAQEIKYTPFGAKESTYIPGEYESAMKNRFRHKPTKITVLKGAAIGLAAILVLTFVGGFGYGQVMRNSATSAIEHMNDEVAQLRTVVLSDSSISAFRSISSAGEGVQSQAAHTVAELSVANREDQPTQVHTGMNNIELGVALAPYFVTCDMMSQIEPDDNTSDEISQCEQFTEGAFAMMERVATYNAITDNFPVSVFGFDKLPDITTDE